MALSKDGKTLYPFLEGPLVGDDPLVRHVYEFDVKDRRYTGRNWTYRMSIPATFVSDAVAFGGDQLIVTERDNGQGPAARLEEGVRHRRAGRQARTWQARDRRPARLKDKDGISLTGARPGDFGLGNPFKFPYQTVEAVLPLSATSCVRQRHQLRLDRPEPEPA